MIAEIVICTPEKHAPEFFKGSRSLKTRTTAEVFQFPTVKFAVAHVASTRERVRIQCGLLNEPSTAPLASLGSDELPQEFGRSFASVIRRSVSSLMTARERLASLMFEIVPFL